MTTGFQTNLLTGLAVALAAASLGTWNTTGVYTTAQTGIVIGTMPQTPDRIIMLTAYGVDDHSDLSDSVIGLQVRCRWGGANPTLVGDLADSVFAYLQNRHDWTVGSGAAAVVVGQCRRVSGPVSLGQDANLRWSNSQNFYLDVWLPSTNRY